MQTKLARPNAFVLGLGLALLMIAGVRAEQGQVKLLLKDGSYQLVKSYEVQGDRVRYYSVERSAWEEIPKSLVDFDATERAQKEEKAAKQKSEEEARAIDKERIQHEAAAAGYELAPAIHLPADEGVFAFDGQRVIRLIQSSAEVVTDKRRAALLLALPGPLVKNRALVVLPGAQAAVRISVPQPAFYVQFADVSIASKLALIPVKPNKESRLVETVQSGMGAGKAGEVRTSIPVERAEIRPGLSKIKPTQALAPGEYALGELLQQKLNLDVWDFGIEAASSK